MAEFQVKGARELERLLRQLPEQMAKTVTVNGLKAGGRVLAKGMSQRAPRRTGKLAESPTVSSAKKATKDLAHAVVGFRKPTSRRVHLTEFGTEDTPAQPFIRPTLEEDGEQALAAIGKVTAAGLAREAKRLARR